MSSFAWLDYSEQERRRMLDLMSQFDEKGTRDELGIGVIRDALADQLFPGTSVIQTRARYFLFVPWIYLQLEEARVSSRDIASRARQAEIRLIHALAESDDTTGVIGIRAKERVRRLPSEVYWLGMGTWGVRRYPGTRDQYHRSLDDFHLLRSGRKRVLRTDDGDPVDGHEAANWHANLPPCPPDFPDTASFGLSVDEAQYLTDRIRYQTHGTLLAHLVSGNAGDAGAFPWEHKGYERFPPHLKEIVHHARNFSETIHGAALLYNLMLARKADHEDWIEGHEANIQLWWSMLQGRAAELQAWSRTRFWQIVAQGHARVQLLTQHFINSWLDRVLGALPAPTTPARPFWESPAVQNLIEDRELRLKQGLARLSNPRALELWSGASGTAQLSFRWPTVRTLMADIIHGRQED